MNDGRRRYDTLNGIRGVAALCVAIFHAHGSFWPEQALSGYLAVDIFFVLSGFVLAEAYGARLVSGSLTVSGLASKRLIRFYPLYLAGLLLGLAQMLAQQATGSENALSSAILPVALVCAVLFIPLVGGPTSIAPLNGPSWSLIYELWVNILWAGICRRIGAASEFVILILSGLVFAYFTVRHGDANIGTHWTEIGSGLARTIYSFTAGLLIYRYRRRIPAMETGWSLLALLAVIALLFFDPPAGLRLPYDLAVALAMSPLLVFLAAGIEPTPSMRPLFLFLGIMSFPLYVIHMCFIAAWIYVERVIDFPPPASLFLFLSILLFLAWLASKADERIRQWLTRHPVKVFGSRI
ncbi:acyltransferase [soil metagenome]